MNEPDLLIGRSIRRGTIELQELIGDGGMGRVYKGVDHTLSRTVAVKILRPEHQSIETARVYFEREARAASKLWHPNIIQIIDFGVDEDGTLFLVMEYIPGKNLADVLEESFPLPSERTIRILTQVLTALEVAHNKGIVHRDLKPENIMLQDVPGNPDFAKVLDFGVAKAVEGDVAGPMTIQGLVMGTPHFMSPEQALGHDIDPRSDLYSIGAILYQMLTARLPFEGRLVMNVLSKVITEKPVPPAERAPNLDIDPALAAISMRAMRKSPEGRFQNAAEFREVLLNALEQQPREAPARRPLSGELSAADLEPFRKRSRSIFTDSVFDFASFQKDLDVSGESREVVVVAAHFRTQMDPNSSRFGQNNSEYEEVFDGAVHRFGGVSLSHIGTTSTAVFGYPRASRDGVKLGVMAALGLAKTLSQRANAEVGIGIAHGPVVIPENELAAAYGTPVEQALNLASSADDGQLLADISTTITGSRIEFDPTSDPKVFLPKTSEPQKLRTTPIEVAIPVLDREEHLDQFRRVISRAQDGHPVAVAVTAPEGGGKSRMLSIVVREAELQRVAVLDAPAEPYAGFLPGLPLARIVTQVLELVPANSRSEALTKLGLGTEEIRIVRALLRGGPPKDLAQHWVDAASVVVTGLLRHVARRVPIIIVVDNFEHVDMLTFTTMFHLTHRLQNERVCVVVAGDEQHPLVQAFAEEHHHLPLIPLSDVVISDYLEDAFPELLPNMVQAIVERAEGSPRNLGLMVEFARLRLPQSADSLPDSPLVVLADRLEALPEAARKLLAIAGALGESVPLDALAGSCPRSWDLRSNLKVIGEAGILSLQEDDQRIWLRFDVPVLARMATKQIPDDTRTQIHMRIARYFEQQRATNPTPDNDFQWARQLRYAGANVAAVERFLVAARRAHGYFGAKITLPLLDALLNAAHSLLTPDHTLFQNSVLKAAMIMLRARHYEDAVGLLARLTQFAGRELKAEHELLIGEGMLALNRDLEARQAIRNALAASEGMPLFQARAHLLMGTLLESHGEFETALVEIETACTLMRRLDQPVPHEQRHVTWRPYLLAGRIQLRSNRFPSAIRALEHAHQEALKHKDSGGVVVVLHALAATYRKWDGMRDQARRAYAEAHSAAVRAGSLAERLQISHDFGTLLIDSEEYDAAHEYLQEAYNLARDFGANEIMMESQTWLERLRNHVGRAETGPAPGYDD